MNFDKKEMQKVDARKAMAEYDAEGDAARAKTARLRALRLARDAADAEAAKSGKPVKATKGAKAAEAEKLLIPVRLAKKRST